jgi:hypothetical protein
LASVFAGVLLAAPPGAGATPPRAQPASIGSHQPVELALKRSEARGAHRRHALAGRPLRHRRLVAYPFRRRIGSSYFYPTRPASVGPAPGLPGQGMPGPQVYTPPSMQPTPQYYTTPGHMQYCGTRYRSYDPTTNTRLDSGGISQPCL